MNFRQAYSDPLQFNGLSSASKNRAQKSVAEADGIPISEDRFHAELLSVRQSSLPSPDQCV